MANRRAIVADDDVDIRFLCRITLEADGFEVAEAIDADELLVLARGGEPPDVVLLDITMPGRDGIDCLRELRQDARLRDVAVIVLSGHVGDALQDEALRLGASGYMTKPFRPAELRRRVRSSLGA